MATLDLPTILLCNAAALTTLALAFLFYWATQRTYPGFVHWAAALAALAIGYLARRPGPPGAASRAGLVVTVLGCLLGVALRLDGTLRFVRATRLPRGLYAAPFAAAVAALVLGSRAGLVVAFLALLAAAAAYQAWVLLGAARPDRNLLYAGLGALHAATAALVLAASARALLGPGQELPLGASGPLHAYLGAVIALEVARAAGLLMANGQRVEAELEGVLAELRRSLAEMKTLRGLLPICSHCKRLRDEHGVWHRLEEYISARSEAEFSHGICPECLEVYYPDMRRSGGRP